MAEQWTRWEPTQGLSAKYYIDNISNDIKEFNILLSESKNENIKILISFDHSVDAYRSTYESFRQKTLAFLDEEYGTQFYSDWTFFKVSNSTYLKWLSEQSYGITNSISPTHFVIYAMNFVLDIAATYEPKVQLIEKE